MRGNGLSRGYGVRKFSRPRNIGRMAGMGRRSAGKRSQGTAAASKGSVRVSGYTRNGKRVAGYTRRKG